MSAAAALAFAQNETFGQLTDDLIARARCADTVNRVVLRCRKRGLELHLYRSGKDARWYARPTIKGQQLRLNLGSLEALPTVAEAHAALTAELVKADRHGAKVLEDRTTFGGLCQEFLAAFGESKRARSHENYKGAIERFIIPRLGSKKLRQIRRADMVDCIEDTYRELTERGLKGSEANTVRAALQGAWRWAMQRGRVEADIVARLPIPADTAPREITVTDEQLKIFWRAVSPGSDAPVSDLLAGAFRVAMTTAQRIGAVLLTNASDLDLTTGTWAIHPQDGTKTKTVHIIALPPLALEQWRRALDLSGAVGDQPVFPADRGRHSKAGTVRQDSAANAMMRLRAAIPALGEVTLHDFRRTARSRIAGEVPRESAERWLGHVIGSKVERTYDTDQHLREKREAAEAWEAYLKAIGITC